MTQSINKLAQIINFHSDSCAHLERAGRYDDVARCRPKDDPCSDISFNPVMAKLQPRQIFHGPGASLADCELPALVRHAIAASLPEGHPTIVQTARAVGISVRSLQRRLLDAGLTYRQLLDEVRHEAACRLLKQGEMNLGRIAAALGYADPANFTRAFQRWTGQKPSAFRRRIRQHARGQD